MTLRRLGIDVGGTKTLGVVVEYGTNGPTVVDEGLMPTDGNADPVAALARFARSFPSVASVGVGFAGLVQRDGVVNQTTHLPGTRGVAMRAELESALGLPVAIDNDATCAAVAEWRMGAGRGCSDVLAVTLGTGIGGGAIVDGKLARGHHGLAAEFGHLVVQRDGEQCKCGRRGCWEMYASGDALSRVSRGLGLDDVLAAAVSGHAEAVRHVDDFARWVALGLANLTNAYDPECIVLGGGLGSRADLLPPVEQHFRGSDRSHAGRPLPRLATAVLGHRAGAIGAALLNDDR